ncbi:hypothetical protein GFS24_19445 [Chitinophaga sp. SYP-B3965]|uniref:hypothetical protein n=1 Tax=Chitinophaga sp. SYP-B3965 TaxID=2663120 RepID=UPI0012999BDA|nr:hypothetical protein [Chitinophaga sp. SYP-B3965]MRG47306.1 hypothetical protein [Chitinophaga sp. SYP-B3965]
MTRFIKDAIRLQEVIDLVQLKGYKNKDLAEYLDIFPSAFSTLMNKVIKPVVKMHIESPEKEIPVAEIFARAGNVSEVKTKRALPHYIEVLENLLGHEDTTQQKSQMGFIEDLIKNTPYDTLKILEGLYDCYYLSSFGYRIKKEPFLIKMNPRHNQYQVFKGNDLGPARYVGLAYISNPQLLTMQLSEVGTMITDHFMAHFVLPPTYSTTVSLLKGIGVSISNSRLPVSRKVILEKVSNKTSMEFFNEQPTTFFEKDEGNDNPIVSYLRSHITKLEYLAVPYESYDKNDLKKEEQVQRLASPDDLPL